MSNAVFAKNTLAQNIKHQNKHQTNPYMADFKKDVDKMMEFYSSDVKFWQDRNCIHPGACQGREHGIWFWAQAAMILVNYQELTNDKKYAGQLKDSYLANWDNILNAEYYDDRLWWALTLLKIYQVNSDIDALNRSKALVASVVDQGSQNVCHGNGGIYWDVARTQVGSIANTLLITAAGRLYQATHDEKYKNIADKTWQWLQQSGLIGFDHSLADNYAVSRKGLCGTLANWHFTYNNGMLLSAVSTLEQINHQKKLASFADDIARKALYDYTKGGVIEEVCTNAYACAEDKYMFKGIFVYNVALYARQYKLSINDIKKQFAQNYEVILNRQSPAQIYAFNWSLPVNFERDDSLYNPADIVTFLSVVYLELANVILNNP
jgi:predicted alpha-1,6-mannanase (GH76 family)